MEAITKAGTDGAYGGDYDFVCIFDAIGAQNVDEAKQIAEGFCPACKALHVEFYPHTTVGVHGCQVAMQNEYEAAMDGWKDSLEADDDS